MKTENRNHLKAGAFIIAFGVCLRSFEGLDIACIGACSRFVSGVRTPCDVQPPKFRENEKKTIALSCKHAWNCRQSVSKMDENTFQEYDHGMIIGLIAKTTTTREEKKSPNNILCSVRKKKQHIHTHIHTPTKHEKKECKMGIVPTKFVKYH